MHFLAYVLGDNPEQQLQQFMSAEHEFIIGRELKTLAGVDEYREPAKILDEIRQAMGVAGKVAVVEHDRVAVDCPQLYHAGFEHFLTVKDGQFYTVNRILVDSERMSEGERAEFDNAREEITEGEYDVRLDDRDFSKMLGSFTGDSIYLESFQIGGEWANRLIAKPGAVGERNAKVVRLHDENRYDRLRIKDIDFEAMWKEWAAPFEERFAAFEKIRAGRPVSSLQQMLHTARTTGKLSSDYKSAEYGKVYGEITEAYDNQPVIQDLKAAGYKTNIVVPELWGRAAYIHHHVQPYKMPFALVHAGKWRQRGKFEFMGIIDDTIPTDEWEKHVDHVLKHVDPNTWLTVVDCHR